MLSSALLKCYLPWLGSGQKQQNRRRCLESLDMLSSALVGWSSYFGYWPQISDWLGCPFPDIDYIPHHWQPQAGGTRSLSCFFHS